MEYLIQKLIKFKLHLDLLLWNYKFILINPFSFFSFIVYFIFYLLLKLIKCILSFSNNFH